MFYRLIQIISMFLFKVYLRIKITGKENIPKKGAFIFAANHSSYLDPFIIVSLTFRVVYYIARDRLLKAGFIGWVLKNAKTIPVKRHGADLSAIKQALKVLKDGNVMGIFPEGVRVKDRVMKRGKAGVGMLVYKANVPVVPVYIGGTFDVMPRGTKTFKRGPISVYIGKAMYFEQEKNMARGEDVYQRISDAIMGEIAGLGKIDQRPQTTDQRP